MRIEHSHCVQYFLIVFGFVAHRTGAAVTRGFNSNVRVQTVFCSNLEMLLSEFRGEEYVDSARLAVALVSFVWCTLINNKTKKGVDVCLCT